MSEKMTFISSSTGKEVTGRVVKRNKRTVILEVTCPKTGKLKEVKRRLK